MPLEEDISFIIMLFWISWSEVIYLGVVTKLSTELSSLPIFSAKFRLFRLGPLKFKKLSTGKDRTGKFDELPSDDY